ncbi:MAG TPA: hypothetical protein V6D19_18005 [Stenomitos sp.]
MHFSSGFSDVLTSIPRDIRMDRSAIASRNLTDVFGWQSTEDGSTLVSYNENNITLATLKG